MNAPIGEKVWFVAGSEMGAVKCVTMIITRALYGLKTSANAWSEFFGQLLNEVGYTPCIADPDVWIEPTVNNIAFSYWSYMLIYMDDCLALYQDPRPVIEDFKSCYKLNNDMYGEPERCLAANIEKYQLKHNERKSYWSMHAYDYIK